MAKKQPMAVTGRLSPADLELCDKFALDPSYSRLLPGIRLRRLCSISFVTVSLYCQVERFYKEQDVELLFGGGIRATDFKDDTLARGLNKSSLLYGMLEYRIRKAMTFEQDPLTLSGNRKAIGYRTGFA